MSLSYHFGLALVLAVGLAACSPTATPVSLTPKLTETSPAPQTPDPTALMARCLPPSELVLAYTDPAAHFCLLYPASFTIRDTAPGRVVFYGPALDQSIEPIMASLTIQFEEAAADSRLDSLVDDYLAKNVPQGPITRQATTLAGEPAVIIEGKIGEGIADSRQVFALHQGRLFHLTLHPVGATFPQAGPDVDLIWQKVEETFTFTP